MNILISFPSFMCINMFLVQDVLFSMTQIKNIIETCKSVVSVCNQSTNFCNELKQIQLVITHHYTLNPTSIFSYSKTHFVLVNILFGFLD